MAKSFADLLACVPLALSLSLSLSLSVRVYVCVCMFVGLFVCLFVCFRSLVIFLACVEVWQRTHVFEFLDLR